MIDYIALAIGHGLLAVALLRLALRGDVDDDPLLSSLASDAQADRQSSSAAGRNARRRAQRADVADVDRR
jgi:hypothetical protein